ncbi:MAG: TetR/AcrR family transcriptional regulator C-terminal ligand-binding domain-containing protein [Acidimicrobiales bacterium]|nr:TetR/AcrR family transcriptional regulator C-terminal ligand-binding domain-containing protein [Acidimicrobiales bacterium]
MGERALDPADSGRPTNRRGRPPIDANRRAVLDATRRVLIRDGYADMTFEAVATEADSYRKYIHRTWSSKAALVRDAIFEDVVDFELPDTGSFEADLRLLMEQHVELNLRPEFLRGLPGLQEAFRIDAELWNDTLERHVQPPEDAFATVLAAALARGEIGAHPDPAVVLNSISGAVQQLARLGLMSADELVDHAVRMVRGGMVSP